MAIRPSPCNTRHVGSRFHSVLRRLPGRGAALAPLAIVAGALALAGAADGWHGGGAARCSQSYGCADVSVSGHAEPQPIKRKGRSELKVTPKNDGPGAAYGIDLQVDVPRQLKILKVVHYGGNSCYFRGTFVQCDLGDFANQQEAVVRITVKGKRKGTWISDAKVYSQGVTDPNGGNNQVSMTIGVQRRR